MLDKLRFSDLSRRHPGVTDGLSLAFEEAVRVCLGRHHASPQMILLRDGTRELNCAAEWTAADPRTTRAWANRDDATRDAAYAVALASIEISRGLVSVRRAETLTGA